MRPITSQARRAAPAHAVRAEPPGRPTDAELIATSVRDPNRFTELFERHWPDLLTFCSSRAGSAGEDIAAESFQTAFDTARLMTLATPTLSPGCSGSLPT